MPASPDGRLRITLFGGLQVEQSGRTITRFKSQKIGGLLAYLSYYLARAHSREVLIDLFWPDSTLEAGRNSLSVALSSLRNQLEPPGTPQNAIIRADRFCVSLNPAAVITDVAEFEAAIAAIGKAAGTTEKLQLMERAVELYEGSLLPGFYDDWITMEQERLAGLYFDCSTRILSSLEISGDHGSALKYARKAYRIDPLREEFQWSLVHFLAVSGHPKAALKQFNEIARLMEAELGEEPSGQLRALASEIESQSGHTDLRVSRVHPNQKAARAVESRSAKLGETRTLTFLMSDLNISTSQSDQATEAIRAALDLRLALQRDEFRRFGGEEVKQSGNAFTVALTSTRKALDCAISCQQALAAQAWPPDTGVARTKMALHTGDVEVHEEGYEGAALNRAARLLAAGHGGQILVSESTAALLQGDMDESARLVDLGVYRLQDFPAPVRLFQLDHAGAQESTFPALTAETGYPSTLPLAFTRFFGREDELARLGKMLVRAKPDRSRSARHESRLVTITGIAGTGKSRLALEAADRLVDQYEGRVWYVPLADLSDPGLIAGTILSALRLPRSPDREPMDQIVDFLERQPSLLVLDNLEHLLDGGAELVKELLARAASLKCLITSRRSLGLPGEKQVPLGPLATPNGPDTPERLTLFESVQLFVDRAQAVLPYFQVTSGNAPAVAELCDRLEGIPLAIELAAARAQVMTPVRMLEQLGRRFELLVSHKRGAVERHRTLGAAIDWSYRLLSPELQRFFTRLSVFRGGWSAEAAEAVCEEPLALDYLAQLRECSLVLTDDSGTEMRFRMLETIREYGHKELTTEARAFVQRRHMEFFLRMAEETEPNLHGAVQPEFLNGLEMEHDNLRVALRWCLGQEEGAAEGLRLSEALQRFWEVRGHLSEGREWYAEALGHAWANERTKERASALNRAGNLAVLQGDYNAARYLSEESLGIYKEIGHKEGVAAALNNMGRIALMYGDGATTRSFCEESLAMYRDLQDSKGIAVTLNILGNAARQLGDYVAARACLEESLGIYRELGDRLGIAGPLNNLGNVARVRCDFVAARSLFDESLGIFREFGDRYATAAGLYNIGIVTRYLGDDAHAVTLHEESLTIRRELGDMQGIADSLHQLGVVPFTQGHYGIASSLFEESLGIYRKIGDKEAIAGLLCYMGRTANSQGDYASARTYLVESLVIGKELGHRLGIAITLKAFAETAYKQRLMTRGARLGAAAEALREMIGAPLPPRDQAPTEREIADAREALGEAGFTAAWESGRAMTLEEAVAFALQEETL